MFVLNHEIEMNEKYHDNMKFIDEMEGTRYSNVTANVEKYEFSPVTLDEVAAKIIECGLIIP